MKKYGEILKEHRLARGKTLLEVESETGISNANLSRWECGKNLPNIDFCVQLANYYEITLDELIDGELQNKPSFKKKNNTEPLPLDESELLKNYRALSYAGKARVAAYADLMREQEQTSTPGTRKKA